MLKKQGAFSDRYMSNPIHSPFTRDKNKQNRSSNLNTNTNGTMEQNQSNTIKTNEQSENKLCRNSLSTKRFVNNSSKLKLEWQKHEKQLNQQIVKLKKQNLRLKEDARKANKNNQDNIYGYEAYIKQIENSRDEKMNKLKIYEEQLKYCILWIVQTFSLGQNPIKNAILIQKKLNKSKMSQVMQKLNKTIHQLELQKYLKQIIKASEKTKQQYLLYQKQHKQANIEKKNSDQFCSLVSESNQLDDHQSVQQFHDLLDTFNLNRQVIDQDDHQDEDAQPIENIARKLFVNEETFGHQIGEHDISNQNPKEEQLFSDEKAFIQSSCQVSVKSGTVVKIKVACNNENDDYLKVKKGDQVRLLRKIGDLWIAQMGCKIGYISDQLFN